MADLTVEELYNHPIVGEIIKKLNSDVKDLENIRIPYTIPNKILMSPGIWNNYYYSVESINKAFKNTDWNDKEIRSLFLDHVDTRTCDWVGEVANVKINENANITGDLVFVDKPTAQKLAYGAKFGISPKVAGSEDYGSMLDFTFKNFSVVINPAVKTAWINNAESLVQSDSNLLNSFIECKNLSGEFKEYSEKVFEHIKKNAHLPISDAVKSIMQEYKTGGNKMAEEKKIEEKPAELNQFAELANSVKDLANVVVTALKAELEDLKKKYPYPEPDAKAPVVPAEEKKPAVNSEVENKAKPNFPSEPFAGPNGEIISAKEFFNSQKRVEELSQKLAEVEKKLNEPARATAKVEQEMSSVNPDLQILNMLNAMQ